MISDLIIIIITTRGRAYIPLPTPILVYNKMIPGGGEEGDP